jgi:hypothetical protein
MKFNQLIKNIMIKRIITEELTPVEISEGLYNSDIKREDKIYLFGIIRIKKISLTKTVKCPVTYIEKDKRGKRIGYLRIEDEVEETQ